MTVAEEEEDENDAPVKVGFRRADRRMPEEPFGVEEGNTLGLLGLVRDERPS